MKGLDELFNKDPARRRNDSPSEAAGSETNEASTEDWAKGEGITDTIRDFLNKALNEVLVQERGRLKIDKEDLIVRGIKEEPDIEHNRRRIIEAFQEARYLALHKDPRNRSDDRDTLEFGFRVLGVSPETRKSIVDEILKEKS